MFLKAKEHRCFGDVMSTYMPLPPDLAIFARQLRQLGVNIAWVGSPSTVGTTALRLAGPALDGSYAGCDFAADSSPAAKEFATKYEANYKSAADLYGAWAYDAVHVLALVIDNAKSLEPQKIREAILSVKGYPAVEGTYNFDQRGAPAASPPDGPGCISNSLGSRYNASIISSFTN